MADRFDPGVARERTALAWRRSSLSLIVVATLTGHLGLAGGVHPLQLGSTGGLLLAAAFCGRRSRRLLRPREDAEARWAADFSSGLAGLSAVTFLTCVATLVQLARLV